MRQTCVVIAAAALVAACPIAGADTVTVRAAADATLYESTLGSVSNGAGQHLFVGVTNTGSRRRAVVRFDLSGLVPADATVTDARLSMVMDKTISERQTLTLHRVTADWSEGSVDAMLEEGSGGGVAPGAVTWVHTSYPEETWAAAGGDYEARATAATEVDRIGLYEWASPELVADVAAWLADPGSNHGWLLRGPETSSLSTKRFTSRQPNPAVGPSLEVTFTAGPACRADFDGNGAVEVSDIFAFLSAWFEGGPGGDFDGSGGVDVGDIFGFLAAWFAGCR